MLRRVLCGHGVVDVNRAVGVLFNRNRNRNHPVRHTRCVAAHSSELAIKHSRKGCFAAVSRLFRMRRTQCFACFAIVSRSPHMEFTLIHSMNP
eukprot:6854591-Prymnesium_polylepis.1